MLFFFSSFYVYSGSITSYVVIMIELLEANPSFKFLYLWKSRKSRPDFHNTGLENGNRFPQISSNMFLLILVPKTRTSCLAFGLWSLDF